MKKSLTALGAILISSATQAALAVQPSLPMGREPLLLRIGATDCQGPIASEGHPILGSDRLEKMREQGKLPDTFVCGRCQYDLGGDTGAAYYVKTCK